ncbi:MAG: B12-binding domain-containing radical SAM protein [Candidatus Altiarchaeota archaeon]|nr:B12-binding domain-containing radical SAM protein [Candidatus Altiarchaeota archaeon]
MKITIISPNILTQKGDLFGSGIPYMPVMLSYLAGYLRSRGFDVDIIDAFGTSPLKITDTGKFLVHGLSAKEVAARVPDDCSAVCIYAESVVTHSIILDMISLIKKRNVPVIIIENTQSVVAYSLKSVHDDFFDAGADYAVTGEPEIRVEKLLEAIDSKDKEGRIGGVFYRKANGSRGIEKISNISDFDSMPLPAWDLFPLENYWRLGYSHGPLSSERYLPIMTSRGCIFECAFCVIPETNRRSWRPRSAVNVVDEMEHFINTHGVREFHLEDLNPTVDKKRIQDICREILKRKLDVIWKIVSGTKIETIDRETVGWMKKAGCRYVSFSPESGSGRVLRLMKKPFDHEYSIDLAGYMHRLGIKSQACFVLGFPGESGADRSLTKKFIKRLAAAGVDEIALFIMTPIPGSGTYGREMNGYSSFEELTFSPKWRKDYGELNRFRMEAYAAFIFWRLVHHPLDSAGSIGHIVRKRFETKMEMTVYRIIRTFLATPYKKAD